MANITTFPLMTEDEIREGFILGTDKNGVTKRIRIADYGKFGGRRLVYADLTGLDPNTCYPVRFSQGEGGICEAEVMLMQYIAYADNPFGGNAASWVFKMNFWGEGWGGYPYPPQLTRIAYHQARHNPSPILQRITLHRMVAECLMLRGGVNYKCVVSNCAVTTYPNGIDDSYFGITIPTKPLADFTQADKDTTRANYQYINY